MPLQTLAKPLRIRPSLFSSLLTALSALFLLTTLVDGVFCGRVALAQTGEANLVRNGGFEGGGGSDGRGGGVPEWSPMGLGYDVDRRIFHGGEQSIRCDSLNVTSVHGAMQTIVLNQPSPTPIAVVGWSRADSVEGNNPADYSIYVDVIYMDGTPLWGRVAAFSQGTHNWERQQVIIYPEKPIRTLTIYALFRYHRGTAWFDDISACPLQGNQIFDGQLLEVPLPPSPTPPWHTLSASKDLSLTLDSRGAISAIRVNGKKLNTTAGGFWVRDVGADGKLMPLVGRVTPRKAGGFNLEGVVSPLHLVFSIALYSKGDSLAVDGTVIDKTGQDRALSLYLVLPVEQPHLVWGQDIRQTVPVGERKELSNQVPVSVGAVGSISRYPFACVAGGFGGIEIAEDIQWPSVFRLFYNAPHHLFVVGWDVALTGKSQVWPARTARVRCALLACPPVPAKMAFRQAALQFYRLNAPFYSQPPKPYGIWMPFTSPESVEGWQDFGFAFHEGDNSMAADNAAGILCFRYIEPSSYWMPMPDSVPRTYQAALQMVQQRAQELMPARPLDSLRDPTPQEWARAVLNSAVENAQGQFYVQFSKVPWNNGALFILNPSPGLPATPEEPTKASLSYTVQAGDRLFAPQSSPQKGHLDGIYLDSLEGWTDTLDYRLSDIQMCPYPLTYDSGFRRTCVPQWYWVHDFARFVSADLHNRGRLLMANDTPNRFCVFAPLVDIMGIEVNWLQEGRFNPEPDSVLSYRRTLCYRKPFLMMMNTDFDDFDHAMVEKYFQRCLFYDLFPSMFSADAATHPYWETPKWYKRDRDLFKRYIPLFQKLSAAGWEPLTWAETDNPQVEVERYGQHLFTLYNAASTAQSCSLHIALQYLPELVGVHQAMVLPGGEAISVKREGQQLIVPLNLSAGQTLVLEMR